MVTAAIWQDYRRRRAADPLRNAEYIWGDLRRATSNKVRQRLLGLPSASQIYSGCTWASGGLVFEIDTVTSDYYDRDYGHGHETRTEYIEHGVQGNSDDFVIEPRRGFGASVEVYTATYTRLERAEYLRKRGWARGPAWLQAWREHRKDVERYIRLLTGWETEVSVRVRCEEHDYQEWSDYDSDQNDEETLESATYALLESAAVYLRSKEEP